MFLDTDSKVWLKPCDAIRTTVLDTGSGDQTGFTRSAVLHTTKLKTYRTA